jgi:hypothetical protein
MVGASHADEARSRPISARHGEHLLLAAPEDAAAMIYALGDTRDERRHPLKICRDYFPVGRDRRPSAIFCARSSAGRCAAPLKPSRPQGYHLISGRPSMHSPLNVAVPERGVTRPRMTFIVVDLPLALPSSNETMRPSRCCRRCCVRPCPFSSSFAAEQRR